MVQFHLKKEKKWNLSIKRKITRKHFEPGLEILIDKGEDEGERSRGGGGGGRY